MPRIYEKQPTITAEVCEESTGEIGEVNEDDEVDEADEVGEDGENNGDGENDATPLSDENKRDAFNNAIMGSVPMVHFLQSSAELKGEQPPTYEQLKLVVMQEKASRKQSGEGSGEGKYYNPKGKGDNKYSKPKTSTKQNKEGSGKTSGGDSKDKGELDSKEIEAYLKADDELCEIQIMHVDVCLDKDKFITEFLADSGATEHLTNSKLIFKSLDE
ncbi:uncharacterized protein LOC107042918 [Diachasma alloeum]|uniref:uncharacterized protein LOC107042918 n=1 Tax=Diachasma alloeum TaxID=454923 RepID=UPI00073847E3|nr:uncharacterized protein LOC107042918 [Diachasma alloeum]